MTHLTSDAVDAVREIVKERIKEFDLQTLHTPSLGIVRLVIEAYELTRCVQAPPAAEPSELRAASAARITGLSVTARQAVDEMQESMVKAPAAREAIRRELAAAWPAMPNLNGGVDHFAEHGIAGDPEAKADADPHAPIYDLLRNLAVDGIMPRQSEYDEAKADDMPSAGRLKQVIGLTWGQLAEKLGLTMLTPIERANLQRAEAAAAEAQAATAPPAPPKGKLPRTLAEVGADAEAHANDPASSQQLTASSQDARQRRVELADKAHALLRGLATDGHMPPISLYNERHAEAGLPDARLLLSALGLNDWGELAADVGLKWNKR